MIVGPCSGASLGHGPARSLGESSSGGNWILIQEAAGSHGWMLIASFAGHGLCSRISRRICPAISWWALG